MSLHLFEEIDPYFAKIERRFQLAGWVLIAVLVGLALAGLFGGGVLSNATKRVSSEGGEVELTYPRFGRQESNLQMTLSVTAPQARQPQLSVVLSGELREKASINSISPEPSSTQVRGKSIAYTWDVADWSGPQTVTVNYESSEWRQIDGRIDVTAGGQELGGISFSQFLFP